MACADTTEVLHEASVTLKAPLGNRRLIDAATGERLETNGAPTRTPVEEPVIDQPASFKSVSLSADGRTITVSFDGGPKACHIYELLAKEDPGGVYLSLTHTTPPTAGVCTETALLREASVPLGDPPGNRRVYDGATGKPLAVT